MRPEGSGKPPVHRFEFHVYVHLPELAGERESVNSDSWMDESFDHSGIPELTPELRDRYAAEIATLDARVKPEEERQDFEARARRRATRKPQGGDLVLKIKEWMGEIEDGAPRQLCFTVFTLAERFYQLSEGEAKKLLRKVRTEGEFVGRLDGSAARTRLKEAMGNAWTELRVEGWKISHRVGPSQTVEYTLRPPESP